MSPQSQRTPALTEPKARQGKAGHGAVGALLSCLPRQLRGTCSSASWCWGFAPGPLSNSQPSCSQGLHWGSAAPGCPRPACRERPDCCGAGNRKKCLLCGQRLRTGSVCPQQPFAPSLPSLSCLFLLPTLSWQSPGLITCMPTPSPGAWYLQLL